MLSQSRIIHGGTNDEAFEEQCFSFYVHKNRHNAPKEKNKTEKRNRSPLNCHIKNILLKKDPFNSTAHYMFYTPNPADFHLSVFR